jgi:hypothetical protein
MITITSKEASIKDIFKGFLTKSFIHKIIYFIVNFLAFITGSPFVSYIRYKVINKDINKDKRTINVVLSSILNIDDNKYIFSLISFELDIGNIK